MPAARYTMGFQPKTGVRVPFHILYANSDADAITFATAIQGLRKAGTRWSLTKHITDNSAHTVTETGSSWKVCLEFKVPLTGGVVKICIEHYKLAADPSALVAAIAANATDPAGNPLGALIRMTVTPELYV